MPTKGWLFMVMHSVEEIWLTSWDGYPMIYRLTGRIIFRHPYQQIQVMFFNASLHTGRVCDRCPAIAAMVLMIEGVAIVLGRNGKSPNGRRVQRVSNGGCSRMTCHVICRKLISCCKHLRPSHTCFLSQASLTSQNVPCSLVVNVLWKYLKYVMNFRYSMILFTLDGGCFRFDSTFLGDRRK